MILHSFYNGIENIILLMAKSKGIPMPDGTKWHKELLAKTFDETGDGLWIFREELEIPLKDYLRLRHFVRHTYGFQLQWEKMKDLLFDMNMVWEKAKEDIIAGIGSATHGD